jgi:hypothetical protein
MSNQKESIALRADAYFHLDRGLPGIVDKLVFTSTTMLLFY